MTPAPVKTPAGLAGGLTPPPFGPPAAESGSLPSSPPWHSRRGRNRIYQELAHIISTAIGDMAREARCPPFMVEETEARVGLLTKRRSMWHGLEASLPS